jgi:hypothetical protein
MWLRNYLQYVREYDKGGFSLGQTLGMAQVRFCEGQIEPWEYEYIKNVIFARYLLGISA